MSENNKFDNPKKSAIYSLIAAIIFVLIDVLIALPLFASFILLYVIVLVPLTLFSIKNNNKHRYYRYKLIIYSLMLIVSFSTFFYKCNVNQQQAEEVINAIYQYQQDKGEYPNELPLLVPNYVDSVPGFLYYSMKEDNVFLTFVAVPPFGRMVWDFEKKEWDYLD